MKSRLLEDIEEELEYCTSLLYAVEDDLKVLPQGKIYVNIKKGKTFYYINKDSVQNKYIRRKDEKIVEDLCNRESCEIIQKSLVAEIASLNKLKKVLHKSYWQDKLAKMHKEKRKCVSNVYLTDEEYAENWRKQKCDEQNTLGLKMQITKKGDKVRSKSEKIIADMLYNLGIDYRYEAPVILPNGLKIFPDFTILDPKTRNEIYWEHFGMIDEAEYAQKAMLKLSELNDSGLVLNKDYICTFETRWFQFPFDYLEEFLIKRFK